MSDYNGWTNYETWCVNLWLSNEAGTSEQVTWIIQDGASSELYAFQVEENLQEHVEELAEMVAPSVVEGASFVTDLFRNSLGRVNWREIVANWASDLDIEIVDARLVSTEDADA